MKPYNSPNQQLLAGQSFFGSPTQDGFFKPVQSAVPGMIQKKCAACEEEDKKIQRKGNGSDRAMHDHDPASLLQPFSSGGHSLSDESRSFFGNSFGYNFNQVKIHTGSEASRATGKINAKAFATGSDIVFNEGQYDPHSYAGRQLLAHELTHVVQQGAVKPVERTEASSENRSGPVSESQSVAFGCGGLNGVTLAGRTDASYSNSFSSSETSHSTSTGCEGCDGPSCISSSGVVVSRFNVSTNVTLPSVPSGLTDCEANAARAFINGTLSAHEQQHVAAFNTYRGTVNTPYNYTGCASGISDYITGIHNGIEATRRSSADAASAALDPFNVPIPCNCPD